MTEAASTACRPVSGRRLRPARRALGDTCLYPRSLISNPWGDIVIPGFLLCLPLLALILALAGSHSNEVAIAKKISLPLALLLFCLMILFPLFHVNFINYKSLEFIYIHPIVNMSVGVFCGVIVLLLIDSFRDSSASAFLIVVIMDGGLFGTFSYFYYAGPRSAISFFSLSFLVGFLIYAMLRPSVVHGGICMTPQKGALSSFLSRNDRAVGQLPPYPAKSDVSERTLLETPSVTCRKSRLRMPLSQDLRHSERR